MSRPLNVGYSFAASAQNMEADFLNQTFNLYEEANCPGRFDSDCPSKWMKPSFGMVPIGFSMVSSGLSAFGALFTILPYIAWKDLRTNIRRVITFLAIADFLTALSYLLGTMNYIIYKHTPTEAMVTACKHFSSICQIQSFLSCWFSVSSFLWTAVLALYLYQKISNGDITRLNQFFPLAQVVSWLLPVALVFPLFVLGYLGHSLFAAGGWCFVKGSNSHNHQLSVKTIMVILLGGKALEISTYIWVMVLFCKIYHKIHKKNPDTIQADLVTNKLLRQVEKKLYAIPVVFVMLRMWGTLQFFISIVAFNIPKIYNTGCLPKWLFYVYYIFAIIQSIGDGGQGWCNFLLYVMWSEKIRDRMLLDPFRKCCLGVTKYLASSSSPSQNYGIINEPEGESSNSSIKFQRQMMLKNTTSDSNECTSLLLNHR